MHEWLARLHTHIHSGYDLVPQTEHVQRVEGDGNPDRSPWWGGHIKGIAVSIDLLGGVIDEVWFVLRSEGKWVRRIGRKRQGGEEMSEWVLGMVVAGEFDIALIFLY